MKARLILFLACLGLLVVAAAIRLPQWAGHAEIAVEAKPGAAAGGMAERADSTVAGLLNLVGLKGAEPARTRARR